MDGNSRALYNQYNGIANFLPRLGLAYSLDSKTVIRAAFSRSSFQEGTGEYNRLATNAPWNVDLVGQWGAHQLRRRDSGQSDHSRSGLRRAGFHRWLHGGQCNLRAGGVLRRSAHSRDRSELPSGGFESMEFHRAARADEVADGAGGLCRPA